MKRIITLALALGASAVVHSAKAATEGALPPPGPFQAPASVPVNTLPPAPEAQPAEKIAQPDFNSDLPVPYWMQNAPRAARAPLAAPRTGGSANDAATGAGNGRANARGNMGVQGGFGFSGNLGAGAYNRARAQGYNQGYGQPYAPPPYGVPYNYGAATQGYPRQPWPQFSWPGYAGNPGFAPGFPSGFPVWAGAFPRPAYPGYGYGVAQPYPARPVNSGVRK